MNQIDLRDNPIPDAQSATTARFHRKATRLPGSRCRLAEKNASSRIRRAVGIAAVFAGLMVAGCTSLPQTGSNECVGPVSYCQLFFGS
ncbi:hypothetical protein [Paraburkholderia sp. BL10I2N1]|uniref:hypothetical protein n=1 Tax=Paraburkholderia sp. BL10I2N1 TaxID=1938796 RepID=UPI00106179CC|nr:hypothetical protein [Paraburkholderia sp. BL10I2N1]TDN61897.1 hypothetical protein B0G77_5402 [Paraburkholderia sp. BL10I2N1]